MDREKLRKRIFDIIQIGNTKDLLSKSFDIFITVVIFINLFGTLFSTYEESVKYSSILDIVELITVIIFTIEFILRLWTADYLYKDKSGFKAAVTFFFSFYGIIDFLTFFPYYLPIVFPAGAVAFRIFRVIRIFRLFKINSRYDAFNVIVDVLNEKKKQIFSSVLMIAILMVASSLFMYSLEHEAQPEVFKNAFSGIWWSASTLLTVGYGDIYPVTTLGKIMAIVLSFLGVGLVAIPTGIISAGFVEQYTKINKITLKEEEKRLNFIAATMTEKHSWNGKLVREVIFPPDTILVALIRDEEEFVPRGDLRMQTGDILIMGAKHYDAKGEVNISEVLIKDEHEWVGTPIKLLSISRQSLIVMIQRKNRTIIPNGDTIIKSGDRVVMYTKHYEK